MPKISVITATIRPKSLDRMREQLKKQTFQDFEWLTEIGFPERGCDLNAANNRMIKHSKGELIVVLEDYLDIPSDGLQKFWDLYQKYPKTCFTAPKGVVTKEIWEMIGVMEDTFSIHEILEDRTSVIAWDWREHGELREIDPPHWEQDWGSAPRQAFFDVGGYNEQFDQGWSWNNPEIAIRMQKAGYNFMVDPSNKAIGLDHNSVIKHPFNRPDNLNADRYNIQRQALEDGMDPKLHYLD